ncbi:hypothetical protein [Caballeronia sp. LZ035]|uniref:beta strand repeat-containing protein n=1 Tax=Caballeronia sp. LZ035 TaxID=3038568 RepID=UPI002859853B|nr:hypothetical protein [Caballeronia sp. LZ035]MDR5757044.1 hypothetical protein [Caballeronia sp. LZ035]
MGILTGSSAISYSAVNLSSPVQADWIQYPGSTTPNRRSGGGSTIGAAVALAGATFGAFTGSEVAVSWSDGTPNASSNATTATGAIYAPNNGVATPPAGQGFSFTVPADTSTRTLTIVWGAYSAAPKLVATLSDGSAAPYTLTPAGPGSGSGEKYLTTITFAANSAGQTLTVAITLVTPATGAYAYVSMQSAGYVISQAAISGIDTEQEANDVAAGSGTSSITGTSSTIQAKSLATGSGTGANMASLSGSSAVSYTTVNLSSPPQTDWIQYPGTTTPNRKASGGSTIGAVTPTAGAVLDSWTGSTTAVTWTDGTPNAASTTTTQAGVLDSPKGVATPTAGQGYTFTVPADTNSRTLKIVWGAYSTSPKLTATLSDGSAAPFTVTPVGPGSGSVENYLTTITYSAASAGQTLTIAVGVVTPVAGAYANVSFQAASYVVTLSTITGIGASTGAKGVTSASGTVRITGTSAETEANDAAAASGGPVSSGAASATQGKNTAAAAATDAITGSGAPLEVKDVTAASGTVAAIPGITGTGSAVEANDTVAAAGVMLLSGLGATSQAKNGAAAAGGPVASGAGAVVEANDAAASAGSPVVGGSAAPSQAKNAAAASGVITALGTINCVGAVTEASDTCAASVSLLTSGVGALSPPSNTAAGAGSVLVGGAAAPAQSRNSVLIQVASGDAGTSSAVQSPNIAQADGSVQGITAISGVATVVQAVNSGNGIATSDITGEEADSQLANVCAAAGESAISGTSSVAQAPNTTVSSARLLGAIDGAGVAVQMPNITSALAGVASAIPIAVSFPISAEIRTYRIISDQLVFTGNPMTYPYVPSFVKDPLAVLDFDWDWSAWLGENETILNVAITAADGLTVDRAAAQDGIATAWISGGTAGTDYAVACTITTTGGRADTRTVVVSVRRR